MAKLEKNITGDFDGLLEKIEKGILSGSDTASLEDSSDFVSGDARCSVRVFERFSYTGGNRLSLSVTLFQNAGGPIHVFAISAGGSNAVLFKMNRWGEEAFLNKLKELI